MEVKQGSGIRYAHTNVVADDWRKIVAFYRDVFDCKPAGPERDHRGPHVEALTGLKDVTIQGVHLRLPGHGDNGPTLEVFQYSENAERPKPAANRPGFTHIAFQVEDVAAKRKDVLAHGGADLGQIQQFTIPNAGNLTVTYMTDPEGNIIEMQNWSG